MNLIVSDTKSTFWETRIYLHCGLDTGLQEFIWCGRVAYWLGIADIIQTDDQKKRYISKWSIREWHHTYPF